ncbi:hypothetical protein [Wenjunlia tyrosinilytica]|uniref:DUF1877 family protein n=1 Tax=Wenjunlia tyrosinilytica TaxID=1544741 RepID=A0A917ZPN3_9ACTN|nr:hypothetical protein [Wenjunlia tyrosinilytica]GGO88307.1 hypothetical protein GCM10012280_28810 [Wenjunlia tyrosinilytica]
MSFYFHLRAVAVNQVKEDAGWLTRLFDFAWDGLVDEADTHAMVSLERDFLDVHHFYTGARHYPDTGEPKTLPVLGGRVVRGAEPDVPPFVILDPPLVVQASAFLDDVRFDDLWSAAAEQLVPPHGAGFTSVLRKTFDRHHDALRGFYAKAADEGDSVVKWLLL